MNKKWWHDKIIYQIYPSSFKDSNNDGIGDIPGIISKLDYLKELGVDILWLTPFFKSPMVDNGYDVADYCDINPIFGTMEDMDLLIEESKKRGMYIMIDIVANHTSNEHPWFKEALKGEDNPYYDYYIFKDHPVNEHHRSCFGGPAWTYVPHLNKYYFHEFASGQPDLNWNNPKVRQEMANAINFWMEKGIKGIRFDVIHMIGKEIDNDIYGYGPTLHERVRELNHNSFGKYDIVTVGEAWGGIQDAKDFSLEKREELNMTFQFEVTSSTNDHSRCGKFTPKPIDTLFAKNTLSKYQYALNDCSWNTLVVENHDLGRCINRFGDENYREVSSKGIALMNYCLKGTPYIYQGQEIGMTNIKMNGLEEYRDVEVFNSYKDLVEERKVLTKEEFLEGCYKEARDNNRTPIQWDDSVNAGFNEGHETWIKVNPNYLDINVKNQQDDPNSILSFYKELLRIRKHSEYSNTLVYGKFESYLNENKDVFVYTREEDKKLCVISNMTNKVVEIDSPFIVNKVILSNYKKELNSRHLVLEPFETILFEVVE